MRHTGTVSVFFLALLSPLCATAAQYQYDDLNRLTQVTDDHGHTIHYHYDAAGNLISVDSQGGDTNRMVGGLPAQDPVLQNLQGGFFSGTPAP